MIPQCPGADEAPELLRQALADAGLAGTSFTVTVVDTDEVARARAFAGSPAFVVDGSDLFAPDGGHGSLACRVYPTPEGPRNLPPVQDLSAALRRWADAAAS